MAELRTLERSTGRYRPWSIREIANKMGVAVTAVNNMRNAHHRDRLTPRMCLALERLTGVRAENWAELQWRYDLHNERKKEKPNEHSQQ